jgi:HK97 family phage major capsid protein
MSANTNTLREKRVKLAADMNAILRQPIISTEDRLKIARISDDIDTTGRQLELEEREERIEAARQDIDHTRFRMYELPKEKEHREAFGQWLRLGNKGITERQRQLVWERRDTDANALAAGIQTLTSSALSSGGAFVPAGFVYDIMEALKYYCNFLDPNVCGQLETATGNILPYPTDNDTTNEAAILAENTSDTEVPVTMGVINFGAYKFSSRIVRVSVELLQDSAFNLEDYLKRKFAIRFGRAYEQYFTTGTGSAQPTGIVTATLAGGVTPVIATGSSTNDGSSNTGTNSIGSNDLIALEHSVDPLYRRGARYILHDQTLKAIKQILDKYGRPLWLPGLSVNAPDTILGYPYVIDNSMPQIGAAKNTVLFGDTSKFIVRKVKDISILRLDERYAEYGQVGFIGFSRVDSNLVDAGTHPVNLLQQHS